MLNITHHQRNANQNHNEIPSHTRMAAIKKSTYKNVGKVAEKKEPSYTVGGKAN